MQWSMEDTVASFISMLELFTNLSRTYFSQLGMLLNKPTNEDGPAVNVRPETQSELQTQTSTSFWSTTHMGVGWVGTWCIFKKQASFLRFDKNSNSCLKTVTSTFFWCCNVQQNRKQFQYADKSNLVLFTNHFSKVQPMSWPLFLWLFSICCSHCFFCFFAGKDDAEGEFCHHWYFAFIHHCLRTLCITTLNGWTVFKEILAWSELYFY